MKAITATTIFVPLLLGALALTNVWTQLNAHGSADIFFAPKIANANWIKTIPGRGFFGGFRLLHLWTPRYSWRDPHCECC